jgi:glycosyltransferase involved in cell wall biosynthesis
MDAAVEQDKPVVWSPVFNVFDKSLSRLRFEVGLSRYIPGFATSWKVNRSYAAHCSHAIALNTDEKKRLETLFPSMKSKTTLIPNGIDVAFAKGNANIFRQHIGLQPDDKYVLNVAYCCPRKNQLGLIRAARNQPWKLVLVGLFDKSRYARQCIEEAEFSGNVILTGPLPYESELLSGAYAGADVFCLPSLSEVQPLTLLEAAVAGCRLVTSQQTPILECLKNHVLICSTSDTHALAHTIAQALSGPSTARDVILLQPTWDDVASRIRSVYEDILCSGV